MSVPDQLRKLAELHADGSLTDDEFTRAKSQLLGEDDASATGATDAHQADRVPHGTPAASTSRLTRKRVVLLSVGAVLLVGLAATATAVVAGSDDPSGSQARPATSAESPLDDAASVSAASPTPTPTPTEVPEPQDSDFRAVAIYTVQTETQSFAGASDSLVKDLLELTCFGLLSTDGKNVDDFGIELAEVGLDSAGVKKAEYPLVIRAATAFCPKAFDDIAARYGD